MAGRFAIKATDRPADVEAAREAALALLERTRRTRSDLTRRLKEKGYVPQAIDGAIERLAGVGLIDDVEYARAWLAGRLGRRPSAWRRLEQQLRQKGIAGDDITAARSRLDQERGATNEIDAARRVVEQAERRYRSLDPRARRQRLYALLARRGFDGGSIQAALSAPSSDRESDSED